MSSGWVRCSVLGAPLPPGWKVCFSVVPKAICLTVSVLLDALALAELELELELEHPAVPSRPAATTVAPSQVAVRRLKVFTRPFVWHQSDARRSGANRADERSIARRRPRSKNLVNTLKIWSTLRAVMDRTAAQVDLSITARLGFRRAGRGAQIRGSMRAPAPASAHGTRGSPRSWPGFARIAGYEQLPGVSGPAGGRVQISRFSTRRWRHAFGWPASGDALARAWRRVNPATGGSVAGRT